MKKSFENILSASALLAVFVVAGCAGGKGHLASGISGPSSVEAGSAESYSFYSPSPNGFPLSYGVNWGDGSAPSNAISVPAGDDFDATHTWTQSGPHTITLTVTDGHGSSSMATHDIQVTNPPAE